MYDQKTNSFVAIEPVWDKYLLFQGEFAIFRILPRCNMQSVTFPSLIGSHEATRALLQLLVVLTKQWFPGIVLLTLRGWGLVRVCSDTRTSTYRGTEEEDYYSMFLRGSAAWNKVCWGYFDERNQIAKICRKLRCTFSTCLHSRVL